MSVATEPMIDTAQQGIPFSRLVKVELRKMVDTKAGLWLMIVTGILLLVAVVATLLVVGLADDVQVSASDLVQIMTIPLSLLLPVFAIVTVTSEWGQRTNLTTFAAEPHRGRIFGSKLVAVLIIALSTIVIAIVAGALTNVLIGVVSDYDPIWNIDGSEFTWTVVLQLLYFVMAFGLAMLLLSTPATIAIYYVVSLLLPFMVYGPLTLFEWARDIVPWLDFNYAATPLITERDFLGDPIEVGAFEWIRFLVVASAWVGIPNVLGWLRVMRTEVK